VSKPTVRELLTNLKCQQDYYHRDECLDFDIGTLASRVEKVLALCQDEKNVAKVLGDQPFLHVDKILRLLDGEEP
jgi:hypothetical protein